MAGKRVLIVDDEATLRTGLREFLEWSGYVPAEAADGTEGLAKAERLRPHVILLDVRMPGIDGLEVCRRLKANPKTRPIPVVILIGVEDDKEGRLAYAAGAVACLSKPFRLNALVAVIEAAIASAARQANPPAESGRNGH